MSVVYEVTLDIEAGRAAEFDAWLKEHVGEMLALPGFLDARILKPEAADRAAARRVVQYTLARRADLDRYLAEEAPRMRALGTDRFGTALTASRRVLDLDQSLVPSPLSLSGSAGAEAHRCKNCGTPLAGKFCAECGQRNHTYVAPLRQILEDFASHHFGFDSKFLHSIVPLLFRPGFLTSEYCAGREERYVKPFRLYLFSSVLFFFLAAIMWPQLEHAGPNDIPGVVAGAGASAGMTPAEKEQMRHKLEQSLTEIDRQADGPEKQLAHMIVQGQLDSLNGVPKAASKAAPAAASSPVREGVSVTVGKVDNDDLVKMDSKTESELRGEKNNSFAQTLMRIKDNQADFKKQFYRNLPKMMFLFLPLIAILLKLLYVRSQRLLVEHFIFTLHLHSMFFVTMLLLMLVLTLVKLVPALTPLKDHAGSVVGWYVAIYFFLALKFFYRQSWLKTALKFFLLFISYWIAMGITMAVGLVLTAVEI